jgi:hypothetical protein
MDPRAADFPADATKTRPPAKKEPGVCGVSIALAQPLDDSGVGHAAALAHGLQAVPPAPLLQGVDEGRHNAGTASSQRVAQCDGTTVDVGSSKNVSLRPIHVLGPGQHDEVICGVSKGLAQPDLMAVRHS